MGGLGLIFPLLLALAILGGIVYQRRGLLGDSRRFPPPGALIDAGGVRLHANVTREAAGMPVVFEAGIAATSLSWRLVEQQVTAFAPALSYDRAGLGWSEPAATPRSLQTLVDELRTLLDRSGLAAPRVVVAHSFGGLIALDYAARFPSEVAGLVLVDPVGAAEWATPSKANRAALRRGIFLARAGEFLAHAGVVRFALNRLSGGSRRLPKMIARATSGRRGQAFTERMVGEIRKLPPELWPMIQAHWCDPKCFRAMARYLQALPESAAAVLGRVRAVDAPLVVLSAANASDQQRSDRERIARLSPRGKLEVVEGSNHWIQLNRPEAVVRAIREVLAAARS